MVEIFKTNVKTRKQAKIIVRLLNRIFTGFEVNFDLTDCDKILRVKSTSEIIYSSLIIDILMEMGFQAEILGDELPQDQVRGPYPQFMYFNS